MTHTDSSTMPYDVTGSPQNGFRVHTGKGKKFIGRVDKLAPGQWQAASKTHSPTKHGNCCDAINAVIEDWIATR